MKKIRVFARVEARPEHVTEVRKLLRGLLAPTRLEDGCLFYDLYEAEAGGVFYFHELWQSRASLERHTKTDHFLHAKERLTTEGLLVSPPEVGEVTEIEQVSA